MPDLRGLFLRGQGGNSAALGVAQGDAIRDIVGSITGSLSYPRGEGAFDGKPMGDYHKGLGASEWTASEHTFRASRVVPTANENRPVNMAVRYLIRALP